MRLYIGTEQNNTIPTAERRALFNQIFMDTLQLLGVLSVHFSKCFQIEKNKILPILHSLNTALAIDSEYLFLSINCNQLFITGYDIFK